MKDEKIDLPIPGNGDEPDNPDRREFLKLLGGGIFVLFTLGDSSGFSQTHGTRGGPQYPDDVNAYLHIREDGRVTCFTGKIEMGQGIITSLAQMLAEELDLPLDRIDMVMGDTERCPYDMGTFGSMSTKYFGPALRQAGAEARAILLQLAARQLQAAPQHLQIKEGMIFKKNDPLKKISFADLTKGKRIERHLREKPPIKPYRKHTISGKPANPSDALEKVTGKAQYAGDVRLPGMLYARLLRPPVHGAKLKSVDLSAVRSLKGAHIVQDNDLIAVLHEHPQGADKALALVKAEFDLPGSQPDNQTIFRHLLKAAAPGEVDSQAGSLEQGKKLASQTCEARYFNHYVAHAPLEPHTAVAKPEGKQITVWASTQAPFRAQTEVAEALGISAKQVRVITPFVGGGFGGKTRNQQAIEAARLAKLTGKPVQVAWSRQEEFFFDTFRPAAVIDINSGLNKNNEIVFWDYNIYFAGSRSSQPLYNIPHYRVLSSGGWMRDPGTHPFNVGAWRGPGSNTNVFAMESHIDILAEKAGMDPLAFRLHNLSDKRMRRVLEAAADLFGHSFSRLPGGKGYGIACTDYRGTYLATMAEVKVESQTGHIKVERLVCAQDLGEVINPEGAKMQIEGGLIMGLGYVLSEEIRFRGGDILDTNFDTYELPRFSWVPAIETRLIDNPNLAPQGGGEPAITSMGGVIANAVYDAIGTRLFELPMTPDRVRAALKEQ
jgi:nicotinate dehydrogenase subunit B